MIKDASEEDISEIIRRLDSLNNNTYKINGLELTMSFAMGSNIFYRDSPISIADAIDVADKSMYIFKERQTKRAFG